MSDHDTRAHTLAELSPSERLEASRAAIIQALARRESPDADAQGRRDTGWMGAVGDAFAGLPLSSMVANGARDWWTRHPWRTTAEFLMDTADELLRPVAKRNPWMLVGGALIVGVVVTRVRPWRWLSGGALVASLLPGLRMNNIGQWVMDTVNRFQAHRSNPPQPEHNVAPPGETHGGTTPSTSRPADSSSAPF